MSVEPLLLALSFDAEADAFDGSIEGSGSCTWRGIEEGIPLIDCLLAQQKDSFGGPAKATWFVRCDDQIAELTGDAGHLLRQYKKCWDTHQDAGDEIGFHPHLYRRELSTWEQEKDAQALAKQIIRSHQAMRAAGFEGRVSRIGEAFGSNAVMNALDKLGIHCDSTAMPGRVRNDATRSIDWLSTPESPYHPSLADYRIPGTPACSLLEIPMTMLMTRAAYDAEPFPRYLDLSFHPTVLREGITALLPKARVIVTVTHPSTVLPNMVSQPHGLISFDITAFEENLNHLTGECQRIGRPFRFVTLRACSEIL